MTYSAREDVRGLSVLLVDDHVQFLEVVAELISGFPGVLTVRTAGTGEEAMIHVARHKPDLVFMDINLPGMNGLEAARAIKAQSDAPCVVILTSHDSEEYRASATQAGADGLVLKSEAAAELPAWIERLQGSGN
jgi:DNA-binding NarL/FixJ family response regulator